MNYLPFLVVNTFADHQGQGCPCGVVLDADDLDAMTMIAVSGETKLPQTVFVSRSPDGRYVLRSFAAGSEPPWAIQAIIAAIFSLAEMSRLRLHSGRTEIGIVYGERALAPTVEVVGKTVQQVTVTRRGVQWLTIHRPLHIATLFGLDLEDFMPYWFIQTVNAGVPHLMLGLRSRGGVERAHINMTAYENYVRGADFHGAHLFSMDRSAGLISRHFAGRQAREVAFSASATASMVAYLWHYGGLTQPRAIVEQDVGRRPGYRARVEVVGPPDHIHSVRVGGRAVVVHRDEIAV